MNLSILKEKMFATFPFSSVDQKQMVFFSLLGVLLPAELVGKIMLLGNERKRGRAQA